MKILPLIEIAAKKHYQINLGAFTYDVRFLCKQVGQAASDFTKQIGLCIKVSDQARTATGMDGTLPH